MKFKKKFNGENTLPIATHPACITLELLDHDSVLDIQKVINCSNEFYHKFMSRDPETGLSRVMCLRLAHYTNTSYEFWYNLQEQYDHAYMTAHEQSIVSTLPIHIEQEK